MEPDSDILSSTDPVESTVKEHEKDKRRRIQEQVDPLQAHDMDLFRLVYEDLRTKSTVGWQNAVNAFETASSHPDTGATVEFLNLCFRQIVSIMLDQHASKIGPTEKHCVIQTLTKGTIICTLQLKAHRIIFLSHMAMILNKKKLFYKEFRGSHMMGQYWNKSNGCPEVRQQCIALFHEHGGFVLLAQALEAAVDDAPSLLALVPMDDIRIFLAAMVELRASIDVGLVYRLSLAVLKLLLALSAADLKKEATDGLGQVLSSIQRSWDVHHASPLQDTMLQVISRFIESTSLPQRLFGFEQLGHLIGSARHVQPYPISYTVSGAGSAHVNGTYLLVRKADGESKSSTATYIQPSTAGSPSPLTLFCCTMKSGSKWWFLSEADKLQPGTDQDVDYYQHQSSLEECLPPMLGWQATGSGVSPAPLLVPTRSPEASIDPSRFDQQILAFVGRQKLLDEIFGDRMHREVVARSTTLLTFLAESHAVAEADLLRIVASTSGKEASLLAEIQSVLVTCVLPYVSDAMLEPFLDHVLASNPTDAALLMEKIAAQYRAILWRPAPAVRSAVARVLWAIQLASPKTSPELLEFFEEVLGHTPADAAQFVEACVTRLRASAAATAATLDEETQVARCLELLKVLLPAASPAPTLVALLFDELVAFVGRNPAASPATDAALRHRLELVQFLHPPAGLGYDAVLRLWTALRPNYADVALEFLREASVFVLGDEAPLALPVCGQLFARLWCAGDAANPVAGLSANGFQCFHTYFVGLNAAAERLVRGPQGIRRIVQLDALEGLDALWTLAMEGSPDVAALATAELLQVYAHVDDAGRHAARVHFVDHVFACLGRAAPQGLQLLAGFVASAPGKLLHGKRGRGAPLTLKCVVQRIPVQVHAEKPVLTLTVFANDPVARLRTLVEAATHHPKTQTKLLAHSMTLIGETKTLAEVGVTESTEVRVVLFQTVVSKAAGDDPWPATVDARADAATPGALLASNEAHLDVLFGLLDAPTTPKATQALVRDLLQQIPTNPAWLARCATPLAAPHTVAGWLAQMPYPKAVYVLEILDGLLMPSAVALGGDAAFVAAFVAHGVPDVLEFLFHTASEEHGIEVALRIVKFACVEHGAAMVPAVQDALVAHLSQLVLSQHSPRVLLDALELIQATATSSQWCVQVFSIALEQTLLHPCEPVRGQWLATLQPTAAVLFAPLAQAIADLRCDVPVCAELFQLLDHVLGHVQPNTALEPLVASLLRLLSPAASHAVLLGALQALARLVRLAPAMAPRVWPAVYDDGLFAMQQVSGSRARSLCSTVETRRAAFAVLEQAVASCPAVQPALLAKLQALLSAAATPKKWGLECNVVARSADDHVGLKNQGCSCYMNSFLQQLFMYRPIRQGLLAASIPTEFPPIEEDGDLAAMPPASLVGRRLMHEAGNGRSFEALITGYDPVTQQHTVRYDDGGSDVQVQVLGNVHMTLLPPVLEGDAATVEVLRQVQRTFWYLQESEMRYFNPKALVEACKCLNLEFSVYQQNDASEFCDKLLDRLEIGLKKTPQGAGCLQANLGGKLISQKLPQGCGHRYEREEAFIRLELQIRGKDSIEASLESFVEGEVMDGDNKVECELCGTKKAATRRTCFGALPNLLVLHLKRFDLDYATFETVKLNNRCSFPLELDMKPYTKEGLEDDADMGMDDRTPYAYALRGVLVHSGVAQGGHYYSFILDQDKHEWFKYDDEDVTPFDPAHIEAECFGGTQKRTSSWNGVTNTMEMEVFSNALMLFYEKVQPVAAPEAAVAPSPLAREVWAANDAFLKHSYVFDADFHEFAKDVVLGTGAREWFALGLRFVLDVVLHSREKKGVSRWVQALLAALAADPALVEWFLSQCSGPQRGPWLVAYLFESPDGIARQSFVHLLARALLLAPADVGAAFMGTLVELWNSVLPLYVDEFFALVRQLCEQSPVLRSALVAQQLLSRLVHFFLGARSLPPLQAAYPHAALSNAQMDFQALFEAIAGLLGLPRRAPEPLLADASSPTQTVALSERAVAAFSELFDEFAVDGGMGVKELQAYFRGTTIGTAKATAKKIKAMLTTGPVLDKAQFLAAYTELAGTATKTVLADLKAHGFGENLQRLPRLDPATDVASVLLDSLPPLCAHALSHADFLESALEEDPEAICDVVSRVAFGVPETSHVVVGALLAQLAAADVGWKGQAVVDVAVTVLSQLLAADPPGLVDAALGGSPTALLVAPRERVGRMAGHPHTSLFVYRYVTLVLELHKVPAVEAALALRRAEWAWLYQWLRLESLKPSLGGRAALLYRDPAKQDTLLALGAALEIPYVPEEKSYIVSGAGFAPVNGVYTVQPQSHDNCLVFSHTSPLDNVEYTLFRCEMPSKTHRWYISHAPNKQTLGTSSDEDFYLCACSIHDDAPPEDGWKPWAKNVAAVAPAPTVRLHASSIDAADALEPMDMDDEDETVEYEDSEDEIRVSNERFQAVHLESPDTTGTM
ncbi:ubiquitin-specific protease [Achlya hypogyna]|uniref:Ubiquitin-specific protease n=1 Tax=Achlya hypogyna TaxID=1202772 RepID=A0A1V9YGP3_ACHHY|nr:ubiquitin-specific protease [Achlya hypogyna]